MWSNTPPIRRTLFGLLLITLALNLYSNDPLFTTIDASGWSAEVEPAAMELEYFMGDKGYTFCASDDPAMLTSAKYIINQFRREWKSQYPISVAHCSELSTSATDELHRLHREAVIHEFGANTTAIAAALFETVDICADATPAKKKRLRGWFCKTMALVSAPFRQVMLIDTDVVWLRSPDLLFQTPSYVSTGALFFRDRVLFEEDREDEDGRPGGTKSKPGQGLRFNQVKSFIELHARDFSGLIVNSTDVARKLLVGGEIAFKSTNYFWRPAVDVKAQKLRHVQESSVVLLNRAKKPRTLRVLRRLLPTFGLGYGDKEIYWIAATIAGEKFAFEPYLAGVYGDCGEVLHFDPTAVVAEKAAPFFINGQFIAEGVEIEGKGLQGLMSRSVEASADATLRALGARDPITGGNCGGCDAAGGCVRVPTDISAAVVRQQQFQLKHVDPLFKHSLMGRLYYLSRRVAAKILPSSMN